MKVHYSKWLSVPIIVIGALNLALGVGLAAVTGELQPQLLVGALATLGGVLCLINPAFVVHADHVALHRPIGGVRRRYAFRSRADVRVDGNRLMVGSERLPVPGWVLNRSEWRALAASLAG